MANEEFYAGYNEAISILLEVIEQMEESGNYHNPTLDEIKDRMM